MTHLQAIAEPRAEYRGLRMSSEEYLALADDGHRYELVDGVVCMSPSPTFDHQSISTEIAAQIAAYLSRNPVGRVVVEVDVRLRGDLVYRPDVVYLRAEKVRRVRGHIAESPDLVVEVISSDSRRYDSETKRADYERAGVGEYWLVDPERRTFRFFVLRDGTYVEAASSGARYVSTAIPGFELDLDRIERLC